MSACNTEVPAEAVQGVDAEGGSAAPAGFDFASAAGAPGEVLVNLAGAMGVALGCVTCFTEMEAPAVAAGVVVVGGIKFACAPPTYVIGRVLSGPLVAEACDESAGDLA